MLASLDTGETIAVVSLFVGMVGTIAGVVWKLQKFVRDNAISPKNFESEIKLQNTKREALEDCVESAFENVKTQMTSAFENVNTQMTSAFENVNLQIETIKTSVVEIRGDFDRRCGDLKKDMKSGFESVGKRITCMETKILNKK